jgi:hypothetical protein
MKTVHCPRCGERIRTLTRAEEARDRRDGITGYTCPREACNAPHQDDPFDIPTTYQENN